jgi:hypothetical protein
MLDLVMTIIKVTGINPNKHLKKIISLIGKLLARILTKTSIITKDKTEKNLRIIANKLLFINLFNLTWNRNNTT